MAGWRPDRGPITLEVQPPQEEHMAYVAKSELDATLAAALAEDPGLRQRLLDDPRGTIAALVGTDIPEMVTITIHEDSLTHVNVVLPAAVDADLSEADLELVAGGICWVDNDPDKIIY
jgi:hypothetical protein